MKNKNIKNNKERRLLIPLIIVIVLILFVSLFAFRNKLTYLEFTTINEKSEKYIELNKPGQEIVQEVIMPYDIMAGFSIKINTFARDNNSEWEIFIKDKENEKIVYKNHFNASLIIDNEYYYIKFNKNIKLNKNKVYEIHITPKSVNDKTSIAFYSSDTKEDKNESETLFINGVAHNELLCLKIYGGDADYWWTGFTIFLAILICLFLIRLYLVKKKGIDPKNDVILQSMFIGFLIFILLSPFAYAETFTDESDNIRGGMIVAKGGVIYKDYVTQHTPITYYLCGIFALLGSTSVQQFRLLYYVFLAIVWALLYLRHKDFFGERKMLILSILECIFIPTVVSLFGIQILSDGIQGICMVSLLLEFISYYKDKKLDFVRAIIISICIWGSFGSAFVSAYALIWIVIVFVFIEIKDWLKTKFSIKKMIGRYWKLLIALIVPLFCSIIYFSMNHSLGRAFKQFYLFNREVYPKYIAGMGEKIIQPFINAIQNFYNIIANNINSIITAQATNTIIVQLLIMSLAVIAIFLLIKDKRKTEAFTLFIVMCCSATRDYGFHGLAAWYIAIMIIALFYDKILNYIQRIGKPLLGIIIIFMTSTYVVSIGNNLLYKQSAISELESKVIEITEPGETIFLDAYTCDSLYFLYKDRYPVNRAIYMLPWYMDWYEQDAIDDLLTNEPNIVIYNEERDTWGYTHYANAFASVLKSEYSQISSNQEDGWKNYVWIKNQ